jgi:hypothetical protein
MIKWLKKKMSSNEEEEVNDEELKNKGFNPEGV